MIALFRCYDGFWRTCFVLTHANPETTQNRAHIYFCLKQHDYRQEHLWVENENICEFDTDIVDTKYNGDLETITEELETITITE